MNNKQFENETIGLVDTMIQHADKGSSAFLGEGHEGCGNSKISVEKQVNEHRREENKIHKAQNAAKLIEKYRDNEEVKELLKAYYGDNIVVMSEFGNLDFSPNNMSDIVSIKSLTYDEYIDIQIQSFGKQRIWFKKCYYNLPSEFMGCIEKKSNDKVCFQKIFVSGMYPDNCSFFEGREDHVWMDIQGFEDFNVGDCASFFAEVYRYIKTGNGKILDYSLRNPGSIKKIDSYKLPSDDDIIRQSVEQIVCKSCYLSEQCNKTFCLRNQKELEILKKQMFDMIKNGEE